ncbi:unnamed protein product [Choristocarpus tenellus]
MSLSHRVDTGPILIRLAWHDSGTYDASIKEWPLCGGANGSIRFDPEIMHGANAGLSKALGYLRKIKFKYPFVSWADLMQMASAEAVEFMGGPKIPIRYGRVDTKLPSECPKEGNLPDGNAPFGDGSKDAASHLRRVFHRMGFSDQEIVALSGAHTIGRAFKERSGTTEHGYGDNGSTKFTCPAAVVRHDGRSGGLVEWRQLSDENFRLCVMVVASFLEAFAMAQCVLLSVMKWSGLVARSPHGFGWCQCSAAVCVRTREKDVLVRFCFFLLVGRCELWDAEMQCVFYFFVVAVCVCVCILFFCVQGST